MTRTEFLREQTVSGANKCRRTLLPPMSTAHEPYSLPVRKAMALKMIFDHMPVYIGPQELIVGTRTFFSAAPENQNAGYDMAAHVLQTRIPYVNEKDIELFGQDQSYRNRTHYTPDFGVILRKGIGGILAEAEERKKDPSLLPINREFLDSVTVAYEGLRGWILRYAAEAVSLAEAEQGIRREELLTIARICEKISNDPADTFHEAVQLLWFAHLGTIVESFEFINYGRLDVLLGGFLKDTPQEEASQLIECLLLKMYDQADLVTTYLGKYAAQLVVTLGGVLSDGTDAVNDVTMMFLDGIDKIRLPEPEFNLRINSLNPPEYLDKAAALTVTGCNFVSYYNDDLFVESLHRAGLPLENAREYAFDLCQNVNIPGKGDFWLVGALALAPILMGVLLRNTEYPDFDSLMAEVKKEIAEAVRGIVNRYDIAEEQMTLLASGNTDAYFEGIRHGGKPVDRNGNSPMAPLPLLSGLFHGCVEKALDVAFEPYPILEKGIIIGMCVEAVNGLAAIRRVVYDERKFTLKEIVDACRNDFAGEDGKYIQTLLWSCPKWGNDDDYVDDIAVELLEFGLRECGKYRTFLGGQVLGGIHQPHPVVNGSGLMATPEGRNKGMPVAVTLTPESGTVRNGPTAVLNSASKLDPMLVQWNFCVMANYYSSVFRGNDGKEAFKMLLKGYFRSGGLQHQPNVCDVEALRKAQLEPEKYRDLIVRLWGVSAHFVDLPKELQDEMIARFA